MATVGPNGQNYGDSIQVSFMPAACRADVASRNIIPCMAAHGFHDQVIYQPAGRFWYFQGIEAGIFVALTAAALGATIWLLHRRASWTT